MTCDPIDAPVRTATRPPDNHFFGYYDKCPWDASGRFLLALGTPVLDRAPDADDAATVGVVDLDDGTPWRAVADTTAWNWQQGAMLQWLGPDADRLIVHNATEGDGFAAVVRDVESGDVVRRLPRPVAAVSRDGRQALCLNFARVHWCRPGYGYAGPADAGRDDPQPAADGVWWMDLASGENRLVVSIADMARREPKPSMADTAHWINHLQFNPGGNRFIFLHRWATDWPTFRTRLYTAAPDGSDVRLLADDDLVSHFDWRDDRHVLVWARRAGQGDHFYLIDDETGEAEIVGGDVLTKDGHCSYSPDRRWILTDEYPDSERRRTLILFRVRDGARFDVGRFYSPPALAGPVRCDLHPRWSRDGAALCFDSAHENGRQVYVMDVSALTAG